MELACSAVSLSPSCSSRIIRVGGMSICPAVGHPGGAFAALVALRQARPAQAFKLGNGRFPTGDGLHRSSHIQILRPEDCKHDSISFRSEWGEWVAEVVREAGCILNAD